MPDPETKVIIDFKFVTDHVVELEYCPGNGTRYVVVICDTGELGRWVASFPNFGSSYWVMRDNMDEVMHPNYVAEKWRINGDAPNEVDAPCMAMAIHLAFKELEGKS